MTKNLRYSKILISGALCILFLIIVLPIQAQSKTNLKVYVWDFSNRDRQKNDLTKNFTIEFEEALIQQNCCTVLQRRDYDRLLAHQDNEKAIIDMKGISQSSLDNFKAIGANTFIFGEVYDDVDAGEIKIRAIVQTFNGEIVASESIRLRRGLRLDPRSREQQMRELTRNLCSSFILPHLVFQNFEENNGTPSGRGNYFRDAWRTTCSFSKFPNDLVHEGRRAVRVEVHVEENGDQGGTVGINPSSSTSIDLSAATTISVRVYDTNGNNTVELKLRDINENISEECWSEKSAVRDEWTNITWNLSDDCFNGIDKSQIKNIELYEYHDGIYYFDDVSWQ